MIAVALAAACAGIGGVAYVLHRAPVRQGALSTTPERECFVVGKIRPRQDATLDHAAPECTGFWQGSPITCTRCDVQHLATSANVAIAAEENRAGIWLQRLTARGAAEIERERRERAS